MIAQIEFPLPDEARVRGQVVNEFKLTLRQEDAEWKVSFAQWSKK